LNRRTPFLYAKRLLYPGTDVATRQRRVFTRHFRTGDIATLDVGCGNGAFSFAAYEKGNRVLGVDLDGQNIARCREYAEFLGVDAKRCRFEVANVYELDRLGEGFDQAIAFEVLEHLARDDEAVRGIASLLSPGGALHVSSPYLNRRPYHGEVLTDVEDGSHLRLGYTFDGFDQLLRGAGLDPVAHATAVGPASRAVLELVNRAGGRGGRAAAAATLVATYPATVLDRAPGATEYGRALILYAQGVKRQ
jgi:SAM-dependent methyltransferase